MNKRKERRDGRYDRIIVPDFDLVGSLYRKSTVGSGTSPPISDRKGRRDIVHGLCNHHIAFANLRSGVDISDVLFHIGLSNRH